MEIIIISDSHGNIANLKHVLGFAKKTKVGAIIHCGDWDNIDSTEVVLNSGIDTYTVLGNADIDPKIERVLDQKAKKFTRTLLEFELHGKKIGVIHDLNQLENSTTRQLDILFTGHTHQQGEMVVGGIKVVNPGALVKDIYFAVYDTTTNRVELVKT